MKRLKLKTLVSLSSLLLISSIASASSETICLLDEDGGCSLSVPVLVASEYFENSNPSKKRIPPKNYAPPEVFDKDSLALNPDFDPRLISQPKAKDYIERALKSYSERCADTMAAYRKKAKKAPILISTSDSDFCGFFGDGSTRAKGQIIKGQGKLQIKIPPESQVHYVDLWAPRGPDIRYDAIVAQSSFQRACAIINAKLLSHDMVHFSYCQATSSSRFLSDDLGERKSFGKRLVFFATPEFDPNTLPLVIKGGLAREGLEDPNFLLKGTLSEFVPLWEDHFEGGHRIDLMVEYSQETSAPISVRDLEQERKDAEAYKNPWQRTVEEDILPVIESFNTFANWLQEKQKKQKENN